MSIEETIRQAVREATEPLRAELAQIRAALSNTTAPAGDRLLKASEVEHVTGYSSETVKRWVRENKLKRHGTERAWRVSERELRQYLAKAKAPAAPEGGPLTEAQIIELAHEKARRQ